MAGKSMLITLPDFDDATSYLVQWSKPVIDAANDKSVRVVSLRKRR
ncbi:hypothetical protein HY993_02540 [Candidatus Micrarchaeota archaeon]|nr:hypothetical protein [Candidatus Micrarchaeota archaeon]